MLSPRVVFSYLENFDQRPWIEINALDALALAGGEQVLPRPGGSQVSRPSRPQFAAMVQQRLGLLNNRGQIIT